MKKTLVALPLIVLALGAGAASAHPGRGMMMMPDTDGDGVTSRDEASAHAAEMFARLDRNGDGQLSEADREGMKMRRDDRRMRMLERIDADKSGTLSRSEFTAGAMARFDRMDSNGDGAISAAEREAARAAWKDRREAMKDARGS